MAVDWTLVIGETSASGEAGAADKSAAASGGERVSFSASVKPPPSAAADDASLEGLSSRAAAKMSDRSGRSGSKSGGGGSPGRRTLASRLRTYQNASFLTTLAQLLFPGACLLIMFATAFGLTMAALARAQVLTATLTAANVRTSCSRQAMVDLRKLQYLVTDSFYLNNAFIYTQDALDCVAWHTQLLVYGSAQRKTFPFAGYAPYAAFSAPVESGVVSEDVLSRASSAAAHELMFGDVCAAIAASGMSAPGFSIDRCRAFDGGTLTEGLLALVDRWYQQSYISAEINVRSYFW